MQYSYFSYTSEGSKIHYNHEVPEFMSQISFFCGHHPDCDVFESQQMFDRALQNFERWFVVTGVMEHMNSSIAVFEKYLPKYFQGSSQLVPSLSWPAPSTSPYPSQHSRDQ